MNSGWDNHQLLHSRQPAFMRRQQTRVCVLQRISRAALASGRAAAAIVFGTGDLSRVSILTRGMLKPGGATLFLSDLGFCLALLQAWVLEQQVGWVQQRCDVGLAWLEPPLLVVPWGPLFHVAASVTHLGLTLRPACTVRWHTWPLAV